MSEIERFARDIGEVKHMLDYIDMLEYCYEGLAGYPWSEEMGWLVDHPPSVPRPRSLSA